MNKSFNKTLHITLSLSRQNQLSNFHTKTHLINHLQNCKTSLSLTYIHTHFLKIGFPNDTFTINHLINGYIRVQKIKEAHQLFDEMLERNVVSWTSVMAGYINAGQPQISLLLFRDMSWSLIFPNCFTFATVVNACSILADLENGRKVHTLIEIFGYRTNLVVGSSLIDMYGKCNNVEEARRIFDSMDCKNVFSWTSMITAYAQNGLGHEALEVFREFNRSKFDRPNHFMLASVINTCASLGKLSTGKVTHGALIRGGYDFNDVVSTSLVDMYAKCGSLEYSRKVFQKICKPSVIPYTSMIVGAAKYGMGKFSLELFQGMIEKGISPNNVTFIGVLHACSHSGLVDEGLDYINSMYTKHKIIPSTKHYTCVVDMLGRVGRLDEAYKMAKSIEVRRDEGALLWGTLLSASRTFGRVDIACEASKWLIETNQQVDSAYVTMSNTYALAGEWENVSDIRSKMKKNSIFKNPGCSWVEIKEFTYIFYSGDVNSCPRGNDVSVLLKELEMRMKERGYLERRKGVVSVDVEEESREEMVGLHSERLALGFGLLCIPEGVTIRVMKNLRICGDCHDAFKLISEIVGRDFVVRDVNRFHHFKDGYCICGDFW